MTLSLEQLLGGLQVRSHHANGSGFPLPPNCLTFADLRHLALQPAEAPPRVLAHLDQCASCFRLAASCAEEIPHLPWWVLLRIGTNQFNPEETRVVRLHFTEGGCVLCRERHQRLTERMPELIRLPTWMAGTVARAADTDRFRLVQVPGGAYEAELITATPQFRCEVRTRDRSLINSLFTFTCYSDRPQYCVEVGYTVLREDLHGWYAGQLVIGNPTTTGNHFSGAYLLTMRPEDLTACEVAQLLSTVGPTLTDPAIRKQWTAWLERTEGELLDGHRSNTQRLVSGLRSRLAQWTSLS